MLHAPRHAHQANHMGMKATWKPMNHHRTHADPALIQREADALGTGTCSRRRREYDAQDDDMMGVGDQEQAVVPASQQGHGQQHAGEAAQDEGHHEADGPQNRHH